MSCDIRFSLLDDLLSSFAVQFLFMFSEPHQTATAICCCRGYLLRDAAVGQGKLLYAWAQPIISSFSLFSSVIMYCICRCIFRVSHISSVRELSLLFALPAHMTIVLSIVLFNRFGHTSAISTYLLTYLLSPLNTYTTQTSLLSYLRWITYW